MKLRPTAFAAAALMTIGTVATAAPAQSARTIDYVALGDSFSAASGVSPTDRSAPVLCLRSQLNYPKLLADKVTTLKDVTCGAAKTDHYRTSQYAGVAPQLDALSAETDLVTMTIGGNDSGTFVGAMLACASAAGATFGYGSPCKKIYGDKFSRTIRETTYPDLVQALTDVKVRSPKARVAILTYPQIMPRDTVGCYPRMPIARGDVAYVNSIQDTLNDAVRRAAKQTGTIVVDVAAQSGGHDACKPSGTRWVEPMLGSTQLVPVHPDAVGEAAMARITAETLGL